MTVNFDLTYKRQLQDEIDATPEEHLPALKPAADSFRTGWQEAMTSQTFPWDVIDHLQTEEDRLEYLVAALEDGDPALVAATVADIARTVSPPSHPNPSFPIRNS